MSKKLLIIFGTLLGLCFVYLANIDNAGRASPTKIAKQGVAEAPESSTGNIAQDKILALSDDDRATALGIVAGKGCVGRRAFYMGSTPERQALWSVGCKNGKSYEVVINADSSGSILILRCDAAKFIGQSCFHKIPDAEE